MLLLLLFCLSHLLSPKVCVLRFYPFISGVRCVGLSLSFMCIVSFSLRLSFFGSHGMITYNHTIPISIHVRIFWLVPCARSLFMLVWKSVGIGLLTSEQVCCCNCPNCSSSIFFVIGIWYNDYNKVSFRVVFFFFLNCNCSFFFVSRPLLTIQSSRVFFFQIIIDIFDDHCDLTRVSMVNGLSLWNCERGAIKQKIYFLFK